MTEEETTTPQENETYNSYVFVNGEWKHINLLLNSGFISASQLASTLSTYYTASETDTLLLSKANTSTTYTKTEVDTLVNTRATSSSVYTKGETDTLLSTKANTSALTDKATTTDLTYKADKSTTYTKTEVDSAIANAISNLQLYIVANELPTTNISVNKIYLIPNSKNDSNNAYDLYLRVNNTWEKLDSIELNVNQFAQASTTYTKSEVDGLLDTDTVTNSSTVSGATLSLALNNLKTTCDNNNTLLTNLNTYLTS